VRFGDKGQYDLGYRYQHFSMPDQGAESSVNYNELRLQYHF